MKKLTALFLAFVLVFSFAACSSQNAEDDITRQSTTAKQEQTLNPNENTSKNTIDNNSKTLIVYFSWSTSGNTEKMAKLIQKQTGGDILEIEPQTAYPTDYNECGDVAKVERDNNERPAIANLPASIEKYDTIIIGYPIWWHTAPMIIGTFLESFDLSGKEVYPFTQSASMDIEQFNNSMDFVRECASNATVHDGLFTSAENTQEIVDYISENGLAK